MELTRDRSEGDGGLHPLGVKISHYKEEKKIPSYRVLADASGLNKTILSRMMSGELLEEPSTRHRILQVIKGLYSLHAISSETEANEILQTVFSNETLRENDEETTIRQLLRMREEEQASSVVSHADRAMELTPLFGREQDLRDILQLLWDEQKRLLTLTGEGGVGKTRLAREVRKKVSTSKDICADGCIYISLAEVNNASSVAPIIAWGLGLRSISDLPVLERLKSYLRDRDLLLVLDNFEQIQEAAPLLTELLLDCTKLKILVTSRTPLFLHYEQVFEVRPLALPDPMKISDISDLKRYAATEMYVQRAQVVDPHFTPTKENIHLIVAICRGLDGLPLAIEIAASRIQNYPPEKLWYDLINAGAGTKIKNPYQDIPERHRTLQETIAWSYNLLNIEQQKLFCRLAVFAGSCSIEAAGEICSIQNDLPPDVSDLAWSLIKWHLVIWQEPKGSLPRLTMLNTIHEYAQEKLEEVGEDAIAEKHLRNFYLKIAHEAEKRLRGHDQIEWYELLESERENFEGVLQQSLGKKGRTGALLRLTTGLWWFWYLSGSWTYGRHWLEKALNQSAVSKNDAVYAKALYAAGTLAFYQSDYGSMTHALLQESITLYRKLNDPVGVAFSQVTSALVRYQPGDAMSSRLLLEESAEILRAAGNEWGVAWAKLFLGYMEFGEGNYKEARTSFKKSLGLYKTEREQHGVAWSFLNLGNVELALAHYEKAVAYYKKSLPLQNKLRDILGMAWSLRSLGFAMFYLEDYGQAVTSLSEGFEKSWKLGDKLGCYGCLQVLAIALTKRGLWTVATQLFAVAEPLHEKIGDAHRMLITPLKDEIERSMKTIRDELGEEAFRKIWQDGQRLAPKDVVASVQTLML